MFACFLQHNIKKIRNNVWKSTETKNSKRILRKGSNGKLILWKHWQLAYQWDQQRISLKLHHKLTPAHFELTPASLMRNQLAVDVLDEDMLRLMRVNFSQKFNHCMLSMEVLQ